MNKRSCVVIVVLTVSILLAALGAEAQDGDFVWAKRIGGAGSDSGYSIAVDSAGNVYTTGYFYDTVDFDPGPDTFNLTAAVEGAPPYWSDIFVSKLDSAGNFVWAKRMGGAADEWEQGNDIIVDVTGNVYITGVFYGTADFDPGPETFNLTSAGYCDIFVLKLDNAGNFVWAKRIGGAGPDTGQGIAVDGAGNVYTTGLFQVTVDFDPGPGTFNLSAVGGTDIFVSKLDSAGNFVWAGIMGGNNFNSGSEIAVDGVGNVYTTGSFQDTVDFDPGTGTFNLTSAGGSDIFVSKLDSAGDFVWAESMGGAGPDFGLGISVDGVGNVYTTGFFQSTADFDPSAGTFNLSSAGDYDIFMSKLDSAGDFVWARSMGGVDLDEARDIAVDGAGNVYTTGCFRDTVDFDPGAGTFNLVSAGEDDGFVLMLDSAGEFVLAESMGGAGDSNGYGITVDDAGNIYTTGHFSDTADFDPGAGTFDLISAGGYDIFVLKLSGPDNTPPSISIGPPSVGMTKNGPVEYDVIYTGEDIVTLAPGDITLDVTGDVTATVSILPAYTVELSNITGTGTLGFTVAAGTASDAAGNLCGPASTAIPVTVAPNVPLATWPVALALLGFGIAAARRRRRQEG